jgi:dTDP-glucose pyrophosphorylase/CBS domain-containing protein
MTDWILQDLCDLCVSPDTPIRDAVGSIDRNTKGIVLVTDEHQHLLGTVTDGDVRRSVLAGRSMDAPVAALLERPSGSPYSQPISAPLGTSREKVRELMVEHSVQQIPVVDGSGAVCGLVTLRELVPERTAKNLKAVIMAGGMGKRLRPLTENMPKPMLPLGDRPVMEHLVEQLRDAGIEHVKVTTHFMPEKIKEHFGDGSNFGVKIDYVSEDRPLGTAGALGLLQPSEGPLLVINGDIVTDLSFREMLAFHREHGADLTVGVRQYDFEVPYGVVQSEGVYVRELQEKPLYTFFVNAGIYLLEPAAHQVIPASEHYDMTDLIARLLEQGRNVVNFPIIEYWLDIGRPEDYRRAEEHMKRRRK